MPCHSSYIWGWRQNIILNIPRFCLLIQILYVSVYRILIKIRFNAMCNTKTLFSGRSYNNHVCILKPKQKQTETSPCIYIQYDQLLHFHILLPRTKLRNPLCQTSYRLLTNLWVMFLAKNVFLYVYPSPVSSFLHITS